MPGAVQAPEGDGEDFYYSRDGEDEYFERSGIRTRYRDNVTAIRILKRTGAGRKDGASKASESKKAEAVTDGSYLFSMRPGRENKYINYSFTADGISFQGRAPVFRNYRAGQKVTVFYDPDNPKKNGLLQPHGLVFAMGAGIGVFSAAGLWQVCRKKRRWP